VPTPRGEKAAIHDKLARIEGLLPGIEACLEVKFGADGLKLMPEIRELQDVEILHAILQAIRTVASLEEMRRVWVSPKRSRKRRT
jgi:hypothetical protein